MRAIIYDRIRLMGIPIREAYAPPTKVSARPVFSAGARHRRAVARRATLRHSSVNKLVIAVARDTSNYDHGDVMYALAYIRVYPARDGNALDRTRGWIFDARARPEFDSGRTVGATQNPAIAQPEL
jgi:3-polyprenyl-4-hydroxybenzoate decarboxylase